MLTAPAVLLLLSSLPSVAPSLAVQVGQDPRPGTVAAELRIGIEAGGFRAPLSDARGRFGSAFARVGDLDGDGIEELAVGSPVRQMGAVDILFLGRDGTVRAVQEIGQDRGGFQGELDGGDRFGDSVLGLGDLDGDGLPELAVGASGDDDGGRDKGAVWILFLTRDGTVRAERKLSETAGGFGSPYGGLQRRDAFGFALGTPGDLDGDGRPELAVGAPGVATALSTVGAVWILFLGREGQVRSTTKIGEGKGGFFGALDIEDRFGSSLTSTSGLDAIATGRLAVGAPGDDDGSNGSGAVWMLDLAPDGSVRLEQKISSTQGNFGGALQARDGFGSGLDFVHDLDGDGRAELAVGASGDDDGGGNGVTDLGALWLLFLAADGRVRAEAKIGATSGGLAGTPGHQGNFGEAVLPLGDLAGDGGDLELLVGAPGLDSAWILTLDRTARVTEQSFLPERISALGSALSRLGSRAADGRPQLVLGDPQNAAFGVESGALWLLTLGSDGSVLNQKKIDARLGSSGLQVADRDRFGQAVASVGDLDGDGVVDLAAGAPGTMGAGALWILFLTPEGDVREARRIANGEGGFTGTIEAGDRFGAALAALGDLDGDGHADLAVGAPDANDYQGALWILFLEADGSVRSQREIDARDVPLPPFGQFGHSLAELGSPVSHGTPVSPVSHWAPNTRYLAAGAPSTSIGSTPVGVVWTLALDRAGSVTAAQSFSLVTPNVSAFNRFGFALTSIGDLDGDGLPELVVGDDSQELVPFVSTGAIWVVYLDEQAASRSALMIQPRSAGFEGNAVKGNALFGSAVASPGDLDADGVADLMVGAPFFDSIYALRLNGVPRFARELQPTPDPAEASSPPRAQ